MGTARAEALQGAVRIAIREVVQVPGEKIGAKWPLGDWQAVAVPLEGLGAAECFGWAVGLERSMLRDQTWWS